jgi:hypothetical protein
VAWKSGYTPSKWLLENELGEINARRRQCGIPWIDENGNLQGANDQEKAERNEQLAAAEAKPSTDAYDRAAASSLMGICFSGGGIRSATFNLGVLQGLAELGLLRCFDYLSSVSGGGYIHQWLAAWISRQSKYKAEQVLAAKVRAAEQQRLPENEIKAIQEKGLSDDEFKTAAEEGFSEVNKKLIPLPDAGSPQSHPEPIRWLRRYSNYLTPEKGLFTADTWVVVATWLRNTILNQIILIASLMFLALVPHGFTLHEIRSGPWAAAIIGAILYFDWEEPRAFPMADCSGRCLRPGWSAARHHLAAVAFQPVVHIAVSSHFRLSLCGQSVRHLCCQLFPAARVDCDHHLCRQCAFLLSAESSPGWKFPQLSRILEPDTQMPGPLKGRFRDSGIYSRRGARFALRCRMDSSYRALDRRALVSCGWILVEAGAGY